MPQYLQKRYKRYLAVLDIPKDLRKHYPGKAPGKHLRKLVQSLETDSLSVAQRRAGPIIASWKGEFARLREEPDDAAYFRRQLQKAKTDAEREKVLEQIDLAAQPMRTYGP